MQTNAAFLHLKYDLFEVEINKESDFAKQTVDYG
jgi:hypothetical protein